MTNRIQPNHWPARARCHGSRNGLMIIAALVCLLVVTSIVGSMLKSALKARQELRVERDSHQAELLLEWGVNRVTARLAIQPEFRGDTWEVPAEAIINNGGGRITSQISLDDGDHSLQVRVTAEYPLGRDFPIHRSHTFQLLSAATQP
jgi:type II secretory pathway component PulK